MLPYALYLLKVTLCSGILFGYYWLMLRNKIFHHYNRFYLLASILLSLALPLIEINIRQSAGTHAPQAIKLLQVVNSNEYLDEIIIRSGPKDFSTAQLVMLLYIITSIVFCYLFIHMLVRIRLLFVKHLHSIVNNIYFVNTIANGTPFSFFKYIFWNDHIDPESATGNQIFKHELAHVQQKHSYDKLFINVVLIFGWCNPFFWLMRKELNMIHEFVADKIAVEDSDTEAFAAMILQAAYPQHRFQLTNPFFYSPIKRRLLMLTKNKKNNVSYIGRILVLPLTVLIFAAFTLKTNTNKSSRALLYNGKKITVVIDAGHGGSDNGAQSPDGNIAEKDLTLSISKKIKALNRNTNINIVLTRETDVYQSPLEKANFTKQRQPDLFLSVHMDGASEDKASLSSGMSVWVAKNNYANSNNSKLFASAIINEFSTGYKLPVVTHPQQSKTGIAVLQGSPCPSVLIEAGYITNSNDLTYLQTTAATEIIATKILAAIEKYAFAKEKNENGIALRSAISSENFPGDKSDTVPVPSLNLETMLKALIIVDGKNKSQAELKSIDPESIEIINVIKGKEAIARYGEKGKYGVVIIKTKSKEIVFNGVNGASVTFELDSPGQKAIVKADTIKIRNSLGPTKQPIIVVDGKIQNKELDINSIPADDIESINVLKDKSAIEKYGEKAVNGALEIITKSKRGIPVSNAPKGNKDIGATIVRYNNNQDWLVASYTKSNPTGKYIPRNDVNTNQEEDDNKIFTKTENDPSFPGGDSAWKVYLSKNINAAMPVEEGWKSGTYKITIRFIVDKYGSISDVQTSDFPGSKTAKQCIDLIKNGPKWLPAKQNGKVVKAYKKQLITFVVEEN